MSTADSLFKSQDWTGSVRAYTMLTKANPNPKTGLIFNRLGVSSINFRGSMMLCLRLEEQ